MATVTLSFVGGSADALMRLPELYRISMDGGVESEPRPGGVGLHFDEFYGWLDCYPVGTVEGICMHYGLTPRIALDLEDDVRGHFDVTWTDPTSP